MNFPFSIVSGKTIHRLVHEHMGECISQVKEAYLAHAAGKSINPPSYFLLFPEKPQSRIIALPAYLGGDTNVSGIKWIASYPENVQHGFPRASAVLVLNSYETGYPFACLESSIISAARTAASAVLGARWMNQGSRRARTLGIVGNGLIARYVYMFLLGDGWEIDEVQLYDTAEGEASQFASSVCQPQRHQRITCAPGLEPLLRASDLIVLTTVAATPYIHDKALLAHNPIVLNISLRDIGPELILSSYNIVDDVEHVMKANTSPHLAEKLSGGRAFVTGTIADLMEGRCQVDRQRPTIFSPFGMGILDLAVGKWLYELATKTGECTQIPDFFYETTR
jgi:N-[(2S)-2-amino-2-carboxyethyl]-L-glutamate dehydrogenase